MALPAILAAALGRGAAVGAAGRAAASGAGAGAIAGNAGKAAEAAQAFGNQMRTVEQRVTTATHSLAGFAGMMAGKFVNAMTAAVGVVEAMGAPIANLVNLANPAKATQWTYALEDAQAVIGRMLIPVLDGLTAGMRKVGDFMAGMEPVFGPLMDKIATWIEGVFDRVTEMAQRNAPVIEMMVDALIVLGDTLFKVVDTVITAVSRLFHWMPRWVARQFGFDEGSTRADFRRSSRGAAARPAQFVGAKSIADEAIKNALTIAATGRQAARPPEKTLESIDEKCDKFFKWAMAWTDNNEPAAEKIADAMRRAQTGKP